MGDSCCYETMMAGMWELCRKLHKIYISSRNLFPDIDLEFGDALVIILGQCVKPKMVQWSTHGVNMTYPRWSTQHPATHLMTLLDPRLPCAGESLCTGTGQRRQRALHIAHGEEQHMDLMQSAKPCQGSASAIRSSYCQDFSLETEHWSDQPR